MIRQFKEANGNGILYMIEDEVSFQQNYYVQVPEYSTHTIAFNKGGDQEIIIDEIKYTFGSGNIIPLMLNQSFRFSRPEDIVMVRFNREFYCIINHDAEVGCVGFLFFGPTPVMFIPLEDTELEKVTKLLDVLREEIGHNDSTQASMLRMLLAQLIITLTRLSKKLYTAKEPAQEQFDLLRKYCLLVEANFRKEKQVKFYAAQLNKSPKTLANLFGKYGGRSPLAIVHDRVVAEAKRLIYYTDKSVKEIAAELGFEDVSHFSKFIKSSTDLTPTELKKHREVQA